MEKVYLEKVSAFFMNNPTGGLFTSRGLCKGKAVALEAVVSLL